VILEALIADICSRMLVPLSDDGRV
jgi:hypothetical protein